MTRSTRCARSAFPPFFAAIRECYNRRAQDPAFERITFCLLGVATPSDLIQDTRTTPFNIGRRIELTDFTEAEAAPLAAGLARGEGRAKRDAGELLPRILHWTGGHPYLTQRLCQAVAGDPGVTDTAGVDRLCEALFLSASARERDDNLLFVRERLLKSEADLASLLDLYGRVRGGQRVEVDDTNPLIDLLRLSGVARVGEGRLQVRNRIYAQVFDREWVTAHMPDAELRRQQAAYRRGLLRASAVAGLVVAVVAALASAALHQAHRARTESRRARAAQAQAMEKAEEASRSLYIADMNLAQRDWEVGNVARLQQLLAETRDRPDRGFEWYYWQRLCHLDMLTILAKANQPLSRALSPDGRILAVSVGDPTATLYDTSTGRKLLTLGGAASGIDCLVFSPDGRRLAAGREDGSVTLWAIGRPLRSFLAVPGPDSLDPAGAAAPIVATLHGHSDAIRCLSFSPDGRQIVTGSTDQTVKLWNAVSGESLLTISTAPEIVSAVGFVRQGKQIVTRISDVRTQIWDARTGRAGLTLPGDNTVAFSPDGRRVIAGSGVHTAVLRETTGRVILTLTDPAGIHAPMVFSPDGRRIATGSGEAAAKVWDAASGRALLALQEPRARSTSNLVFSPDGRRIITRGAISPTVWDARTGRRLFLLNGHRGAVWQIAVSPDSARVVTGSEDNTARVWDLRTGAELLTLRGHTDHLGPVQFTAGGRRVLTSDQHTVKLWNPAASREARALTGHQGGIWTVAFSPDGRRIITSSEDKTARVWETATGRLLRVFGGHKEPVGGAAFSPDGRQIVTGSPDGAPRVWDAATGRVLLTLRGHTLGAVAVAFSPDGRHIITGSNDTTAKIWDAATGRLLRTLRGHQEHINGVVVSADGRRIVTASWDRTARIWDAATGRLLHVLRGHTAGLYGAAISPDGRRVITCSHDYTAKVWDTDTGQELYTLRGRHVAFTSAAFSPDGRRIATGSWGTATELWDAGTGREILSLTGHTGGVLSVAFSPDGRRMVTGSNDSTAKLWEAASPQQVAAWSREDATASAAAAVESARAAQEEQQSAAREARRDALQIVASSGPGEVQLRWRPLPQATGYRLYRSLTAHGVGPAALTELTSRPMASTSFIDRDPRLAAGRPVTYALAPVFPPAKRSAGNEGTGSEPQRLEGADRRLWEGQRVTWQAIPAQPPPGWTSSSLNEGDMAGAAFFAGGSGEITLRGSGQGIWGDADQCYFLHRPLVGDFRITVTAIRELRTEWDEAGLMLRESLDPGAREVSLLTIFNHAFCLRKWRSSSHGDTEQAVLLTTRRPQPRLRLRLTRRGSMGRAEYSLDEGKTFLPAGEPVTFSPPLSGSLLVGLAISPQAPSRLTEATFGLPEIEKP